MAKNMDFTTKTLKNWGWAFVGVFCMCPIFLFGQYSLTGSISNAQKEHVPVGKIEVYLFNADASFYKELFTNKNGEFKFNNLPKDQYTLHIFGAGFQQQEHFLKLTQDTVLAFSLTPLQVDISVIEVPVEDERNGRLRDVDGMGIYASKKTEVIDCKKLISLGNNSARQTYAKIAGLNIWENDNSGIQLNIGGRGLSPNRTSNFNTRQNGYDISADALGYPESYYTPPAQALERIEIIRGAASLQYGTQFGGMLNFRLKKAPKDKLFEFTTANSYGMYNFINTFNSIGGSTPNDKVKYYGFYQFKRGDGWRPYAGYNVHNGHFSIEFRPSKRIKIHAEQTIFYYLAQQPGGLTDQEFYTNPRQSKRVRNWFKVDWKLSALSFDFQLSERTKLNIRNFALFGRRESLGNLQPINRPDYGENRNLIKGRYQNIGNETRILHRYKFLKHQSTFLAGARVYKGLTTQQQGFSNADSTGTYQDFQFSIPSDGILSSDFQFPSFNAAAFIENYFVLSPKFSITPGIRYEFIQTRAKGYYQNLVTAQGTSGIDTLLNEAIAEERQSNRSIFLLGIGASYRPNEKMEIYTNFSQNYRAINFNDMRINNPNQEIDPNLRDERGFNMDLGIRGYYKKMWHFDVSAFYLAYKDRIGNLQSERPDEENPFLIEPYTLRTNIGNAHIVGLETLIEGDIWRMLRPNQDKYELGIGLFVNASTIYGRYAPNANSFAAGKQLEFVPPFTLRTGLDIQYKKLLLHYQYSYTHQHFTDATNATQVPNAVVGIIPSYGVMDISLRYEWKAWQFQIGVNNLLNARYFTRRAANYPGPGILPADGISVLGTIQYQFSIPKKQKSWSDLLEANANKQ